LYACTYAGALVHSSVPLPELLDSGAGGAPEWVCRQGTVADGDGSPLHRWLDDDGDEWVRMSRTTAGYRLSFPVGLDVHIAPPDIVWRTTRVISDVTVRHLLLDQVLPLANSLRNVFGLHGSAVSIGGSAVLFVGRSGQGKSTLAASMVAAGATLLADDYVVLQPSPAGWNAVPSYPGARLWADSRTRLDTPLSALAPLADYTTKLRVVLPATHATVPLRRIVMPAWSDVDRPRLRAATAADAIDLLRFVFRLDIDERAGLERDFDRASALVRDGFVKRFDAPRRFDALDDMRVTILADLAAPD
jgi:hypothetical protein